jgi:hypothetical protein
MQRSSACITCAYNSRLPIVSGLTANATSIAMTSAASVAATAAPLVPIYVGEGLDATTAATTATNTAAALTLSQYMNQAGYVVEFPEHVDELGMSFSFSSLGTGTLVSGEYSRLFDYPFQLSLDTVLGAVLSPVQFDPNVGATPLGEFGADTVIHGYRRSDRTQAALGIRQLLGPQVRATQVLIDLDLAWVHVHDLPNNGDVPLQRIDATANSWGYRVAVGAEYSSLFGGVNMTPRVVFGRDVSGTTPAPTATFVDGRRLAQLGAGFSYLERIEVRSRAHALFGRRRRKSAARSRLRPGAVHVLLPMIYSERQQQRRGATLGVVVVAIALWLPTVAADESALTPIGAERAGNADGSIPPWKGGDHATAAELRSAQALRRSVSGRRGAVHDRREQRAGICRQAQRGPARAARRIPGYVAYARLPDAAQRVVSRFRLRRGAAQRGDGQRLLDGKGGVSDARVGSPFRLPKNGLEAIWNHNLRWRGLRVERSEGSASRHAERAVYARAVDSAVRVPVRRARRQSGLEVLERSLRGEIENARTGAA